MTTHEREDGKIICELDKAPCHAIAIHLRDYHPQVSLDDYKRQFPDAPLLSPFAISQLEARRAQKAAASAVATSTADGTIATATQQIEAVGRKPMHEIFGFGRSKAALSAKSEPIMIDVFEPAGEGLAEFIAPIDPNYVFDIELTKNILIAHRLNENIYLWGFHGSGKTSAIEQVCARTNRLFSRVQHTNDMESSHIMGQYVVRNGATVWQDGPLPIAMKIGAVYCADEYDAAPPGVLVGYQSVLEGKPLIIKEAPPESRIVKAHPNFRFAATGNTSGCGDETGLYQGTLVQNAANFSRFGITEQVHYMAPAVEAAIISAQARIKKEAAEKFVEFATEIRKNYASSNIGCIVSTRELIKAARLGVVKGAAWREGLRLAFTNRQTKVDQEVINQFSQRIFG